MNKTPNTNQKESAPSEVVRSDWQNFAAKVESGENVFPPNGWLSTKEISSNE